MKLSGRDATRRFAYTDANEEHLENLDTTNVEIIPPDEYVSKAVEDLKRVKPNILMKITVIRTNLDKNVYGEYVSDTPHTIYLNMTKLKNEVKSELSGATAKEIEKQIEFQTAIVASHEIGHQRSYSESRNTSEVPAEQMEEEMRGKLENKFK